ncbi:FkbM family methyltransferase [Mesorhizobium sp. NPDC059025]|uniref:FkbM family methyltransferase n=1 Tax=unclassified Mesorhizobium TaxID=325217 RepID=UPI00366B1FD3
MTSYYDIENCYKLILGRPLNHQERELINHNFLELTDIPLEEHRRRFLTSTEFHERHGELVFDNFVPKSTIILFETVDGFKIYLDLRQYHISFGIMSGEYEKFDIELVKAIVPDEGHFIDVGGNVGYYSLSVAAKPKFSGNILAFEPLPKLWELFDRSIKENGFTAQAVVRQLALADRSGEMELSDAEKTINAGATRLVAHSVRAGEAGHVTRVETLDNVIQHHRPDVIKVDIEGAEELFLAGATQTVTRHRPTMLMEINRDMLAVLSKTSPGAIYRHVSALGYGIWSVEDRKLIHIQNESMLETQFPFGKVANILAVHGDRMKEVQERIKPLGSELERIQAKKIRRKKADVALTALSYPTTRTGDSESNDGKGSLQGLEAT